MTSRCDAIDNWKEALAAALTYAHATDKPRFQSLCSTMGSRLATSGALQEAMICFVCAGDLDRVVELWMSTRGVGEAKNEADKTRRLQDLVEVVMMLKNAVEMQHGVGGGGGLNIQPGGPLSTQLTTYASMLAAQGALEAALTYLSDTNDESIQALKERLQVRPRRR